MLLTTCSLGLGELRSSNSTPHKHPQRQIKKAKNLFAKQGIVVPIIVDKHHHIIDGHLRFMVEEVGFEPTVDFHLRRFSRPRFGAS